jgi:hypothetical protein
MGINDFPSNRHPSTEHMLNLLEPNPNLPEGLPKMISMNIAELAVNVTADLKDSPELTAGLRKLWEAKNSLVAAAIMFNDGNAVDYRDR